MRDQTIYLPPESYQQEVEQFYEEKRGSNPALLDAFLYFEEEFNEVADLFYGDFWSTEPLNRTKESIDRLSLAKELADVMFTLYGVAITAGINLDVAFQLVCDSNMTKELTPEGKVQKGESYIEPDMTEALL